MKKSYLIPVLVLTLVTLACGFGDVSQMVGKSEPTPTQTKPVLVDPTSPPQKIPTAEPSATIVVPTPTEEPEATEESDEPTEPTYFREEFDGSVDWTYEYIYGNTKEQCENPGLVNGQLHWACRSGEETQIRMYEDVHNYEDVGIQVEIENFGSNTNWTALMCRVNENGWIEFRFSTSGLYEIYRFDASLRQQDKNPYVYIGNGATQFLKSGKVKNQVAMVCAGEEFTFYANGNQIKTNITTKGIKEFAILGSGGVGIGFQVMGDNPGPVDVGVEWFETFAP
jgi:hypothetical protein